MNRLTISPHSFSGWDLIVESDMEEKNCLLSLKLKRRNRKKYESK
jgi:hypothetical protein